MLLTTKRPYRGLLCNCEIFANLPMFESLVGRDGLSDDTEEEVRAPVTRISDKTLAWILIRHAAPFLHRADINCVQLLLWSQVDNTVIRSSQFL